MTAAFAHRLVTAQADRAPDRIAVVTEASHWSYSRLRRRADGLAHALLHRGLRPEGRVGLLLERSPEAVAAMLATLQAGGCYVPLAVDHPDERVARLAEAGEIDLLLTREDRLRRLGSVKVPTLTLDGDRAEIEAPPTRPPAAEPEDPDRLAYVIHTSGSTGTPKGVMITHRGLAWLCRGWSECFGFGPGDRASQLASLGFDASVQEIWPYLAAGGCLVIVPPEVRTSTEALRDWLGARRIDQAFVPTLMLDEILAEPWREPGAPRILNTGGDLLRRVPSPDHPFSVTNGYGLAETTVATALGPLEPGDPVPPPIGRPFPGSEVLLVDPELRPVPDGEPGELAVAGDSLARGYLHRPAETARAFVPHPSGPPGARLYRTGDRGRLRSDGRLDFMGRIDHQIQVRGQRLEPGEVEACLVLLDEVAAAVVIGHGEAGSLRLVAYVVPEAGHEPAAESLRARLARELPPHMVPAVFVFLRALPRTAHGKVDRDALPPPAEGATGALPSTPLERRLSEIWAEVLELPRVGVDDDFLELGGHSLRANRILAAVRRELGVALPLAALFEHPTVASLARAVESAPRAEESAPPPRPEGPVPASYPQEAIWFLHQIEPDLLAYNSQATLHFEGRLDAGALHRALTEMIRRHELFRTTFEVVDDRPVQVVHPPFPARLACTDLRAVPPEHRDRALADVLDTELVRPMALDRLPLIRWHLVDLGAEGSVLVHAEHHFLHDGWSFGIFMRELRALYQAFLDGTEPPPRQPGIQYSDYALWQRRWLEGPEAAEQIRYWRESLDDPPVPALELPGDRPRPATFGFRGGARRGPLSPDTVEAARSFARESRSTLYATCLAAFDALLTRWSGQEDFAVGVSMANRRRLEHMSLIGLLVNIMPLRVDTGGDPSFGELARRTRASLLEAQGHQEIPFERIVEEVRPDRTLRHNLLFQASFNFHDAPMPEFSLGGVPFRPREAYEIGATKFDLHVIGMPRRQQHAGAEDELMLLWEYTSELFDAATIDRMRRQYEVLLAAGCHHPETPISRLPLLDPAERHAVLHEWGTGAPVPDDARGAHRFFEESARRDPDRIAITLGSPPVTEALSYGELDRRSEALAHRLRARGIGPEARVGLCLERRPGLAVAVLATLKAGAAYVPLDPAYPLQRLAWMMEDAAVQALLVLGDPPAALRAAVPAGVETILLDGGPGDGDGHPGGPSPEPPPRDVDRDLADHPAYVIYTSGSTGRPKGVVLPHRVLTHLVRWTTRVMERPRRQLQFASLSFDASFTELFTAWASGGSVVMVPEAVRPDPEGLGALIDRQGVTSAILPVTVIDHLARVADERGDGALWSLETLVSTGERLKVTPAVRRLFRERPALRLQNHYGPSETHVVTAVTLGGPPDDWPAEPSIGRPLPGARALVLDRALQPSPVGVPGELYLGGVVLARGYLNRPGLTAERFVPDPFGGGRLYTTGDRCRWLPDGRLEFLGRLDDQVKIRGFRIEPGEVEAALGAHPEVARAVVVARALPSGEAGLVAYVVAEDPREPPGTDSLRGHLRRQLPEHMIPGVFVSLESLPLGPTGKVDRRALPAPEAGDAAGDEPPVAPRNPVEEVIAHLWRRVLGRPVPSVRQSFFDLGGHSLQAVRVASDLRRIFRIDLPAQIVFEAPTMESLGQRLTRSEGDPGLSERIALTFLEVERMSDEEIRELG